MSRNCPVDRLVQSMATRLQVQEEDVTQVLDAVASQYLAKRQRLDPAEAEARLGPELDDLAVVLAHAVDHMANATADYLSSVMASYMQARGMTLAHLYNVLQANSMEKELDARLGPDASVSVRAVPMEGLGDFLRQVIGEDAADLEAEIQAELQRAKGTKFQA